jgi:hypothetical protein
MAFVKVEGKTKFEYLPVTASTAIAAGALVAWSSGLLIAATSSTAGYSIAGKLVKAIAATDSDYATSARLVAVEVPMESNVVWEADVTSGLTATDRGAFQDLTDASTVDRSASTYDIVQCKKVVSATKGHFYLNIGPLAKAK